MSLHDALQAAARWPHMVEDIRMWASWHEPSLLIETLDRLQSQCREFSGFINENEELLTRIAPCEVEVNDWVYPHASAAAAALAWWIQRSIWAVVDHRSYWDAIEGDQSKRFDLEMIRQPDKLEACRKEIDRLFAGGWWGTKVYSGIAAKVEIERGRYVTNVGGKGLTKVQVKKWTPEPEPDLVSKSGRLKAWKTVVGQDEQWRFEIDGEEQPSTATTAMVVVALMKHPDGLSKDQLAKLSGVDRAQRTLNDLLKRGGKWSEVIVLPGGKGKGGYRINPEPAAEFGTISAPK